MLFQPTNITPDVINGIGNGTIDYTSGLTVSWQVNGNTPMRAYQIYVYQNNSSSTAVYNTSKITLSTPFSGVDYQGNLQMFTATTITSGNISNGNQYKLMIRQWYGTGNDDYIDQKSMSVFNTRANPTTSISAVNGNGSSFTTSLATRNATFTGNYSQTQNDPIDYVSWKISGRDTAAVDSDYVTLYDSGKIYGTSELKLEYDGFLNGYSYVVEMSLQTSYGVKSTATKSFSVSWSVTDLPSVVNVCKLNNQSTAMRLTWSGFRYDQGVPTGSYSIANGVLKLPSGSNVVWNEENGSALSIPTPWAVKVQSKLQKADMSIVIKFSSSSVTLKYLVASREISYVINNIITNIYYPIPYDTTVQFVVTPTHIYFNFLDEVGGRTPSNSLRPGNLITPGNATSFTIVSHTDSIEYTQSAITEVRVNGAQDVDYIQILSDYTQDELDELTAVDMEYDPSQNVFDSTYFLLDFADNTLDAGTLKIAGTTLEGWAIYRRNESESMATHIADVPISAFQVLDYGCGSQEGYYHYDVYPIGGQKYITSPIRTRSFIPCFENWSVIEATYDNDNKYYKVVNEFIFGKNLSSGTISNNNTPTVYKNFTPYATVLKARPNFQSGTLSSLIGYVGYYSYTVQSGDTLEKIAVRFRTTEAQIINDNPDVSFSYSLVPGTIIKVFMQDMVQYFDDKKLRDAIWNLSTTNNTLFLKSRKGDVMRIAPSQDISMSYMDNAKQQPVSVSFPWVQTGDATNEKIIGSVL